MIIKMQKVDPHTERGAKILIKKSDRDVSSLEKSSADILNINFPIECKHSNLHLKLLNQT